MNTFVILMRDINVGGKNTLPMKALELCLEELGFDNVETHIQSGNVILNPRLDAKATATMIQRRCRRSSILTVQSPGYWHLNARHFRR
jgi:uncharacterized protein (DUF1697 family)